LDEVAADFPELTLVAFHMGYSQCDDMNGENLGKLLGIDTSIRRVK
jgi:hypothetical protein